MKLNLEPQRVLVLMPRLSSIDAHSSESILNPRPMLWLGEVLQWNTSR